MLDRDDVVYLRVLEGLTLLLFFKDARRVREDQKDIIKERLMRIRRGEVAQLWREHVDAAKSLIAIAAPAQAHSSAIVGPAR